MRVAPPEWRRAPTPLRTHTPDAPPPPLRAVRGYKAQCELLFAHLSSLIAAMEARHESVVRPNPAAKPGRRRADALKLAAAGAERGATLRDRWWRACICPRA